MATTLNNYLARVKLIHAGTLAELETAVNTFMSGSYTGTDALAPGERVLRVDVDLNTPPPVIIWTATLSIAGSTTTA